MWIPKIAGCENLLSHKNTEYNFSNGVVTLFFGVNEDDSGCDSNGSGKSTIIEIVNLCLTSESYRDLNKEEFIREGEEECKVWLELENDLTKDKLSIERFFVKKSSSKVKIKLNGIELKEETSVSSSDKKIVEIIGVNKEDLLNYFIINQGSNNNFFTCGDTKQKEIISRFASFDKVDQIISDLKTENKQYQTDKIVLETERRAIVTAIQSCEEDVELEIENAEKKVKVLLDSYVEDIQSKKDRLQKIEKEAIEVKASIDKKKKQVAHLESQVDESVDERVRNLQFELSSTKKDISQAEDLKNDLCKKKAGLITCPDCGKKFSLKENVHVDDIDSGIEQVEEIILESEKILKSQQERLSSLKDKSEQNSNIRDEIRREKNQIKILKENEDDLISESERLLLNISKIEKKILEVKKSSEQESNLPILEKKLLDLKVSFEDIEGRLNTTTGEILENEQLQYHFGTKGFKTYLTNKVIKTIETFINFHLSKLNTNLSVRINGYKKLANGDVRDKIETFIIRNGVSVGKYARYSGGQKERINICAIIALNELNNTVLESGKGLDLLILDEQLDGLDDKGRMEALNILQQKKMTTIVVSHLTSDLQLGESFKRVVVRYKNGISKIS